jgi:glycosyltransferase involved in cell wall biosynthesis
MKIVILATRLPYPAISGGVKRLVSICEHLHGLGHTLTLVTFTCSVQEEKYLLDGALNGLFKKIYHVRIGLFLKLLNLAQGVFRDKPFQVMLFRSRKMRVLIKKINESDGQDLSICHMVRAAEYQDLIKTDIKILELTDSLALNYARKADRLIGYNLKSIILRVIYSIEAKRLKKFELKCVTRNHKSVVVSDIDRDFILSGSDDSSEISDRIKTIPLGISDDFFIPEIKEYDENTILFIGKMDYFPNEEAVVYFMDYVFAKIKCRLPNAKFKIVGANPSSYLQSVALKDSSIIVTGRVDDLVEHVTGAALSVALMQSGSGMQTKILESIALGVPVVTNQLGFEGNGLKKNSDLMVAFDADEAVDMICELMSNRSLRMQQSVQGKIALQNLYCSSKILSSYII